MQEWNCSLWAGFGTDYAYVQTGQKGWAINGTTLAMTKPGSTVPGLINSCLASFMQTEEYYNICAKHGFVDNCYPNSFFPNGGGATKSYDKLTNEHTGSCSTGYCPCGAEPTTVAPAIVTSDASKVNFASLAGFLCFVAALG